VRQKENYVPLLFNLFILLISLLFIGIAIGKLSSDAALAPILVCSLVIVLTLIAIVLDLRTIKNKVSSASTGDTEVEEVQQKKPMMMILTLTCIYYLLVVYLGFFISTLAFLSMVPLLYKYKNYKFIIGSCIVLMLVYWVGFSVLMNIRFPKGILF
jgi:putative tricarboxylic transport membrane protein